MRISAAILLAAVLAIPCFVDSVAQAPAPTLMTESAIGPVRAGMTAAEIAALGLPARSTFERVEDDIRQRIDITVTPGAVVSALMSENAIKGAYAIKTEASAFATAQGARVGMTFEDIQRRHPGGARKLDDEAKHALIYELPGGRAAFEFDVRNVPRGCFHANDGCNTPGPACNIVHRACADAWIGKQARRFVAYAPPARQAS